VSRLFISEVLRMPRTARQMLFIPLLLAVSGLVARAGAQTPHLSSAPEQALDAAQPLGYDDALSRALDAHSRGDYELARLFMERAHTLEPSARTLRGLAIVAIAQSRFLDAIRRLDAALASDVKPLTEELRANVKELLAHAWSQVGRYEVVIDPPEGDFLVNRRPPDLYGPRTIVLPPGAYLLTIVVPGRQPHDIKLESVAGAQQTLRLVVVPAPPPAVVERVIVRPAARLSPVSLGAEPPNAPLPEVDATRVRRGALVAGSVLLGSGAALWFTNYSRVKRHAESCAPVCADQDPGKLAAWSGALGGIGAATLIGVGAYDLWAWRQRARRTELRAGAGSLLLEGRF
jgi:hypothetical protein